MANTTRNRRVNQRSDYYDRVSYVEGNTARNLQTVPEYEEPRRRRVSRNTARNRARAMQMSRGYVIFLTLASVATLFACVQFLQLKAEMTAQLKQVAVLESQLSELRADNDAYYNEIVSSVDLEKIREKAINDLGMGYAASDQVVTYTTTGNSYVRQYQDVPEAK